MQIKLHHHVKWWIQTKKKKSGIVWASLLGKHCRYLTGVQNECHYCFQSRFVGRIITCMWLKMDRYESQCLKHESNECSFCSLGHRGDSCLHQRRAMTQTVQTNGVQPLSKTWELSLYELQRTPQVSVRVPKLYIILPNNIITLNTRCFQYLCLLDRDLPFGKSSLPFGPWGFCFL